MKRCCRRCSKDFEGISGFEWYCSVCAKERIKETDEKSFERWHNWKKL